MINPYDTENKISYFRKKLGLTQSELRDRIYQATGRKFRQATISSWEKGNSTPSLRIMQALAKILLVQVDDLYEKSVLAEDNVMYHQDIKVFLKALDEAEDLFKTDKEKGFQLLLEKYKDLVDRLGDLSDSNAKLKAKFNSISELMRS